MAHRANSMETILTFENNDLQSNWSVTWSTHHIPGMDNARGGGPRRESGRRRLRFGALALGLFLAMHCHVTAAAITGGIFVFTIFMIVCVGLLGNSVRHFEVYLGQWSISGPGRAFRIIPMLDGIGIAICINCIIRAICCCCIASTTALDFDLKPYEPTHKTRISYLGLTDNYNPDPNVTLYYIREHRNMVWNNYTYYKQNSVTRRNVIKRTASCNEVFTDPFPTLYTTPAFNFFYVELMNLRPKEPWWKFNITLAISIIMIWCLIWFFMISERLKYGKLIWNNVYPWLIAIPCTWAIVILVIAGIHLGTSAEILFHDIFRTGAKEMAFGISDAMEIALYIHSASTGTELVHGKGLNHYASGHIDPSLHTENMIHSILVMSLAVIHSMGGAICMCLDYTSVKQFQNLYESTLWILPVYSRCALIDHYSHTTSILIFSGLTISYVTVAFIFLKTALHTIFEYRVKLVFVEQFIVGGLVIVGTLLSLLFATNGGIKIMESVNGIICGLSMPFVCLLELIGILYVYRSHDFLSDIMIATEDNTCGSRISTQWHILSIIIVACLFCKIISLSDAEIQIRYIYIALLPLAGVVLAVPIRACHNACVFLKPAPRRET